MVVIFLSLLHISNSGQWIFGEFMCKINVFFQQFVLLISILSLLLMCAERAIGKNSLLKNVISKNNIYFCIFGIYIISIICCIPLFLKDFVTLPDRYHFQCLLNGQAPIGYTYFMIFLYIIITLTIGIGLILIRIQKHVHRSLPNSQEEYGRFINETRELHENTNLTKLTVYLLITYAILQLPYIILIFYNRFKEASLYESSTSFISIYSDFETLITFLRFMFPFISAIIISFRCFDIWVKIVNLICCRRTGPITINQWNNNMNATNNINQQTFFSGNCDNNVITIVATGNGMELRIPKEIVQNPLIYDKPPPSYIEMNNEKDNTNVNGTNSKNENINIIEGDPNIPSQSNKPINEIVTNDINTQPHKLTSKNTKPKIKLFLNAGIYKREIESEFLNETTISTISDSDKIKHSIINETEILKNDNEIESSGDIDTLINTETTNSLINTTESFYDGVNENNLNLIEEKFIAIDPVNNYTEMHTTTELTLNEDITTDSTIITSLPDIHKCPCKISHNFLHSNNYSIIFNLTNFINSTFSPTILFSPIITNNDDKKMFCDCDCMCKINELLNKTKVTSTTTTTTMATTTIPEDKKIIYISNRQRQCKCTCDNESIINFLDTINYKKLKGKLCKCTCDMKSLLSITTTINPPTINTLQPNKKKLCKCICEKEEFFDKQMTTTVKSTKKKLCKCTCDKE
ncbi:G protein-coupled receptor, rhodopsin-like family and GPCR, rhodopsin-like, 7TM domain-containing protein [Strongyloides ratti]|uniref:G protein-coupled receptor, rhodopsin-like family and GPCR, rhodopsin-like, 7TM domain-containing protein n=1 Tax=Strongyloides ratti TaxID=34506 RepID=A0A090MTD0_STRRB|nr:G protein-coupled receptor, rhodopsin-like family and GPCR, rhodopsin-like, 7TM domain-containing protein [Strongyloides ratti]CEF61578.1 G protein-coupled receptor, rhodopsin-like family and GPCR, rhodopsin-like, 7TM domain-containing protein [Strongyloides ratti]